jgi:hypothetical protein
MLKYVAMSVLSLSAVCFAQETSEPAEVASNEVSSVEVEASSAESSSESVAE